MAQDILVWTCGIAVVATGLLSGVFLTFSDFVMRSLGAISPTAGVEAMQQINRKVYRSLFITIMLGAVPAGLVLGGYALLVLQGDAANWIAAGCVLYLAGVLLVTIYGNVPMNEKLDRMDSNATQTSVYWAVYLRNWTLWNHVRTASNAAAMVCFVIAFHILSGQPG